MKHWYIIMTKDGIFFGIEKTKKEFLEFMEQNEFILRAFGPIFSQHDLLDVAISINDTLSGIYSESATEKLKALIKTLFRFSIWYDGRRRFIIFEVNDAYPYIRPNEDILSCETREDAEYFLFQLQ